MSEPLKKGDLAMIVSAPHPSGADCVGRIVTCTSERFEGSDGTRIYVDIPDPVPPSTIRILVHRPYWSWTVADLRKIAGPDIDVTTRHEETIDA